MNTFLFYSGQESDDISKGAFFVLCSSAKPGPRVVAFGCCTGIIPCLVHLTFRPNLVAKPPAYTLVTCRGCLACCFLVDSPLCQRTCASLDIAAVMLSLGQSGVCSSCSCLYNIYAFKSCIIIKRNTNFGDQLYNLLNPFRSNMASFPFPLSIQWNIKE